MQMWEKMYEAMLGKAAEAAIQESKRDGMAGIVGPMRLYYRMGEMILTHKTETPDGFRFSGFEMPCDVPYNMFYTWIRNHAGRLECIPQDWHEAAS